MTWHIQRVANGFILTVRSARTHEIQRQYVSHTFEELVSHLRGEAEE